MESVLGRYRNLTILVGVLFLQVLGLAIQVKRTSENESSRLIRVWAVQAVTPFEKSIVWVQHGSSNLWHNYFYLRGVRQENRDLRQEIQQMEIERVRLSEDANQARRLQALLGFKEQFIAKTLAAQVIGSSGSEQSRLVYIDKGSSDGVKRDMAVITANGVIGKTLQVFPTTSQVLLINDQSSGVGALLEKSRAQGIVRGTPNGTVTLEKIMSDETVQDGDKVLTSGGDQIFPKGLPVGIVTRVSPGPDLFLNIRIRPSVDLSKLEEVLVITQEEEREPVTPDGATLRAADILAERLPSVPPKPTPEAHSSALAPHLKPETTPQQGTKPDAQTPTRIVNTAVPKQPAAPKRQTEPQNTSGDAAPAEVKPQPETPQSEPSTTPPAGQDTPH